MVQRIGPVAHSMRTHKPIDRHWTHSLHERHDPPPANARQILGSHALAVVLLTTAAAVALPTTANASLRSELAAAGETHASSSVVITELKTEHLTEPLGLQTSQPRFRWLLESKERGQIQTAYQVLVASSLAKLEAGIGDKWDSGRVQSDNSIEVLYRGGELASRERSYWKVRIWDRDGKASAFSSPSFFEMGLREPGDWKGRWIAARKGVSAPLFRHTLKLDRAVARARIYVSGLGFYEVSLNGSKVGDRVLDPASTYYNDDGLSGTQSRVLYSAYDVTSAIQSGENVVGVVLGNGWYSAEADSDWVRAPYGDRPRLLLQMDIEMADGERLSLVSDSSWKTSPGPITYNDFVHGETYDATREQPGWDKPAFDDSAWENVAIAEPPSGMLVAQLVPPSRVVETLPMVKILTPKGPTLFRQTYIYDFGQHFSGWTRIAVSGPRGTKLVLRYGSKVYSEDDTLDNRSSSTPMLSAKQTDTYILKGEGVEIWEPRFSLHGFRYVEVAGFRDGLSLQKIEGRFVRSAVEPSGSFTSSNELLNRIHENIRWSFMSSLQGILQDATDRGERWAFLGDPSFVAEDYLYNFDMVGFFEKWLNDIRDSQKQDGDVPIVSPLHLRSHGSFDLYLMWPCFKSTYPELVWYLYQYYGDRAVVEDHYPNLKKLISFMTARAKDHLIEGGLGDHMEPQENGVSSFWPQHTPAELTSTAYYYYDVVLLQRMAQALGRSSDARNYQRLAQEIAAAFNRRFFDPTTHEYGPGSQASNAIPLYLGLVAPENVHAVMQNLVRDITIAHDTHVSTGIIGSNALVQSLPRNGAASLMYRLATQTTYPSLGQQVMRGATTICETYECNPGLSQNMKMFGSLDKFFFRDLAGINPAAPGYRRARIQPLPVEDLQSVKAWHKTVRGLVAVEWFRAATSVDIKVTIPVGMEAEIAIPTQRMMNLHLTESGKTIWEADHYVSGTAGLSGATKEGDTILVRAGSGSYAFSMNGDLY